MRWLLCTSFFVVFAACDRETAPSDAVEFDGSTGDQCAVVVPRRPDDCYEQPPCIYVDVIVHLKRARDGGLEAVAESGTGFLREDVPRVWSQAFIGNSAENLAARVGEMALAVGVTTPLVEVCVAIDPDQSLSFAEVMDFQNALTPQIRRAQLFAQLADSP